MNDSLGIEVPWDKGFYFVPEFSKYAINDKGVLKNLATNRVISWVNFQGKKTKNIKGGYKVTNIYRDDGKRKGVSRHRLLALLFIPCPGNPDDYNVNHKNGTPGDDRLENLEWVTPTENVKHAYENNLYPNKTKPVLLRYWETGDEYRFNNVSECARFADISVHTLFSRLAAAPGKAHTDGLQIKWDNDTPWFDPEEILVNTRKTSDYATKDLASGKVYLYRSLRQLANSHGFNYEVVRRRVCKGVTSPHKGYLIQEWSPDMVWSQ